MNTYAESLTQYVRLPTREVQIGLLRLGSAQPIRVQTMTTTDSMDTAGTIAQSVRCIEAGAELVRITAPSKNEAENLSPIKAGLNNLGYTVPLVADIHFTPNAAEIAATIVEKVRINPGNYVDKKKFEQLEYTDEEYAEEIDRIRQRFTPLVRLCKQHGTAMRIGTNHGSLSDRIMSRYGDTPVGMVESAMEFLRIARSEDFHQIVLSMKSSNPQVMVQAYRLLVKNMQTEFGECYPLHLGVTEAGDGEDGRIKSAIGIGTLLEDGIGDTIRVSLTEDPEFEIPVCKSIAERYESGSLAGIGERAILPDIENLPYSPFQYFKRESFAVGNIGGKNVPVVIADLSKLPEVKRENLADLGYIYDAPTDKWFIGDAAADYIFCSSEVRFELPGTLRVIVDSKSWTNSANQGSHLPILDAGDYLKSDHLSSASVKFVMLDCFSAGYPPLNLLEFFEKIANDSSVVICLSSTNRNSMQSIRRMFIELMLRSIRNPVVVISDSNHLNINDSLIHYSIETGALLIDGFGDGICLGHHFNDVKVAPQVKALNSIAFGILQATRTRISKTEYISCPSCGRTLFDLQETTSRIRAVTHHLKGVKIAIMGCIVNGPGEMADADFGYVGSGVGKITLYRGKEIVKRNIDSEVAVEELIALLKESNAWVDR